MLLRLLFPLLLPVFALAQDCDCCKVRDKGHAQFNSGAYPDAKSTWQTAKKMPDAAAKCKDLDALIAKAQSKITPPPPVIDSIPPIKPFLSNPISSPVTHRKKSGLTMIPVEGDKYTMGGTGSDECPHDVVVGSFAIGQFEVTQADWLEVMGENPSNFTNCDECPVEQVSWDDIQQFITKANTKYGRNFRLPSEEEWEFAARGGKKSKKYEYAGSNTIGEVAWHDRNSGNKSHAVGSKVSNELGLFDMSGSVWEWCQDIWEPYLAAQNRIKRMLLVACCEAGRGTIIYIIAVPLLASGTMHLTDSLVAGFVWPKINTFCTFTFLPFFAFD